ncbi:hypothetical protein KM043_007238 [Ampulex compressa]|nr:hypothetical protein KM043_007238 [Ampulex compressa]
MSIRAAGMSTDEEDEDEYSFDSIEAEKESHQNEERCIPELNIRDVCQSGYVHDLQEYFKSHDINGVICTGWTPLLYAASAANVEAVRYLLINGADPDKHGGYEVPLTALCSYQWPSDDNCLQCLRSLIAANVNADAINNIKVTALMLACAHRNKEFVSELVQHVKNVDARDALGQTALFYAVKNNRPDIVKVLIENKADTTIKDKNNLTASDIAYIKEYKDVYVLLNPYKDVTTSACETSQTTCISNRLEWNDMFPSLATNSSNIINSDVSTILTGMNLDTYINNFKGIDLKTFLQLTEEDLMCLGVNISVHQKQFVKYLEKFHVKPWSIKSIGVIDQSAPYTIYDGVVSLGIVAKQVGVICASYRYIIKNIEKGSNKKICFSLPEDIKYESESERTHANLCNLKKNLLLLKELAKKIDKENDIGVPATFIGQKKTNDWFVPITITVIGILWMLTRK